MKDWVSGRERWRISGGREEREVITLLGGWWALKVRDRGWEVCGQ